MAERREPRLRASISSSNTALHQTSLSRWGVKTRRALSYAGRVGIVLGVETSCDDTAAAVVDEHFHVLSSVVESSLDQHRAFGGVVPELAGRAHVTTVVPVIRRALDESPDGLPGGLGFSNTNAHDEGGLARSDTGGATNMVDETLNSDELLMFLVLLVVSLIMHLARGRGPTV